MSLMDKFPALESFTSNIKEIVFGENNSRLDTILDYFFSIRQEKRIKIILYSIVGSIVLFVIIILLYIYALHSLQNKLVSAANNIQELETISPHYMSINSKFNSFTSSLLTSNQYTTLTNALIQKTKDMGYDPPTFPPKPALINIPSSDPLSKQFEKVKLDYKIKNISLTKILDYMNAIQQMDNKLQVKSFEIQQQFDTKLYFTLILSLEAYVPSNKNQDQ